MLFDDPLTIMIAPNLFKRGPLAVRQIAAGFSRRHMSPYHGPGAASPLGGCDAAADNSALQ